MEPPPETRTASRAGRVISSGRPGKTLPRYPSRRSRATASHLPSCPRDGPRGVALARCRAPARGAHRCVALPRDGCSRGRARGTACTTTRDAVSAARDDRHSVPVLWRHHGSGSARSRRRARRGRSISTCVADARRLAVRRRRTATVVVADPHGALVSHRCRARVGRGLAVVAVRSDRGLGSAPTPSPYIGAL